MKLCDVKQCIGKKNGIISGGPVNKRIFRFLDFFYLFIYLLQSIQICHINCIPKNLLYIRLEGYINLKRTQAFLQAFFWVRFTYISQGTATFYFGYKDILHYYLPILNFIW